MSYVLNCDAVSSPTSLREANIANHVMDYLLDAPGWMRSDKFTIMVYPFGDIRGDDECIDYIAMVTSDTRQWCYRVGADVFGDDCVIKCSGDGCNIDNLKRFDAEDMEFAEYQLSNDFGNDDAQADGRKRDAQRKMFDTDGSVDEATQRGYDHAGDIVLDDQMGKAV